MQQKIVRAMPGCSQAEILRPAYSVEYDMVRPHQIHATGMTKLVEGLFLAGQINGTSGYEEAAARTRRRRQRRVLPRAEERMDARATRRTSAC